jgi:hypothetical protein
MRDVRSFASRGAAVLFVVAAVIAASERADAGPPRVQLVALKSARVLAADPSCCTPVQACCPTPCIRYIDRTCHKPCCGDCKPPIKTVLKVVNPVTCCPVEVPVCLPACCDGCPVVDGQRGLLCRGVVTYDWCCGYRVVVRFDRCGDVTVVYRG